MKTMKTVTKKIEEINDMICNKCGKTLKQIISTDGDYNFCGLEEVKMICGYGSQNDGITFTFSLCEQCVLEMIETFKIPVEQRDSVLENIFHFMKK